MSSGGRHMMRKILHCRHGISRGKRSIRACGTEGSCGKGAGGAGGRREGEINGTRLGARGW